MRALNWLLVVCGVAVCGCGGGDDSPKHTLTPAAIAGGGVKGPALAGHIDAFVIDPSGDPIEHASLVLGEGSAARVVGETDAKGFLRVDDASLVDRAVLGAKAAGFAGATYAGLTGSLVTFVLSPVAPPKDTIQLSGTISGWDSLAAPGAGKYRAARVVPSLPVSLNTFDSLAPSQKDDCFRDATTTGNCALSLEIPASSERLLAVIVEGDDAGTSADRSDDTLVVTGLAVSNTPQNGADLSLDVIPNEQTASAAVTFGNATGLVGVIGVPGVSANGQVTVYPSFPGKTSEFLVPTASDALAQANLWAVAFASNAGGDARSLVVTRGIEAPKTAPSEPLALTVGDFLSPPAVSVAGATLQITRVPSAALHQITIGGSTPQDVWILDDRTSFELPSDPSVSAAEVRVTATDAPFEPLNFSLSELATTLTRRAVQQGK